MIKPSFLCAFSIATALVAAEAPVSYSGSITLPADLYTPDGIRLEKGAYQVEIKPRNDGASLAFSSDYKVKAVVNGQAPQGDPAVMPATTPWMGALYLRSSADPVATAQERQFSKTGRTQYEEETRDWKAALRSYQSSDGPDVYFVFQLRGVKGQWKRVDFRLSSKPVR